MSLQDVLRQIIKSQTTHKSVRLIGNNLIVVLNDGSVLSKSDSNKEEYDAILQANTTMEIKELMGVKLTNEEDMKTTSMKQMKKTISKRTIKF